MTVNELLAKLMQLVIENPANGELKVTDYDTNDEIPEDQKVRAVLDCVEKDKKSVMIYSSNRYL